MGRDAHRHNQGGDEFEEDPWDNGTAVCIVLADAPYFGEVIDYENGMYTIRWSDETVLSYDVAETNSMVQDAYDKVEVDRAKESAKSPDLSSTQPAMVHAKRLERWHTVLLNMVPQNDVSKLVQWANTPAEQSFEAWQGDRLLGAAVATALPTVTGIKQVGPATKLAARALSNQFLAKHVSEMLPAAHRQALRSYIVKSSDRQLGTLMEFFVARARSMSSPEIFNASLNGLAEWMIIKAQEEGALCVWFTNPKGYLIEKGGTINTKLVGGPSHVPTWEASAVIDDFKETCVGHGAKLDAEEKAARMVLEKYTRTFKVD
mmetsp:Transcript_22457/g.63796  ORF Transcript_22457/g.63796 Transcript_22457/m.63796 type:complete len:318 (+) Transcript_22457:20-973(+)